MRAAALIMAAASCAGAVDLGYSMSLEQMKETSQLVNTFSLSQELLSRITLDMGATFAANRSIDLDRFVDSRIGSASVAWSPTERIQLSSGVTRNVLLEERFGGTVQDQVENTASGQVRYTPSDWISLDVSLGTHFQDYVRLSGDSTQSGTNSGGLRNLALSIQKQLFGRMSASLGLLENRTLGSASDNGSDGLTGRVAYSFSDDYDGGSLVVEVGADRFFTTWEDSGDSHREQVWSHQITLTLPTFFERVSIQLGNGWDWDKRYWEDPADTLSQGDPRDRLQRIRNVSGRLNWTMLDDLSASVEIGRSLDRNDRKRSSTGYEQLFDVYDVADDRVFSTTLTYTPGRSRITFVRNIQLYRFDTMGTWFGPGDSLYEDNSDRDELREVLSLDFETPVSDRLTLLGAVQGQNLETIYLKSEYSANSKQSSTYSFIPGYRYDLGDDWTVSHSIKLSADYTTFRFPESSYSGDDLLLRKVDSNIQVLNISTDSTMLGVGYRLRLQDQGSFEGGVYSRSQESVNSTVTLNAGFHPGGSIGITPSYSYEYSRREFLVSPIPPQIEHMHHLGLRTRMALGEGLLSLELTRTIYADDRPSFWNAMVGFNYVF